MFQHASFIGKYSFLRATWRGSSSPTAKDVSGIECEAGAATPPPTQQVIKIEAKLEQTNRKSFYCKIIYDSNPFYIKKNVKHASPHHPLSKKFSSSRIALSGQTWSHAFFSFLAQFPISSRPYSRQNLSNTLEVVLLFWKKFGTAHYLTPPFSGASRLKTPYVQFDKYFGPAMASMNNLTRGLDMLGHRPIVDQAVFISLSLCTNTCPASWASKLTRVWERSTTQTHKQRLVLIVKDILQQCLLLSVPGIQWSSPDSISLSKCF